MLQWGSDPFFQQPEIFFGNLDDDEDFDSSIQLDLNLVFDRHSLDQPLSPTSLQFHWFELSE